MAMRWSSRVAMTPPPGGGPARPAMARSSPRASASTPQAAKPSTMAARRSLSLTRSSPRPCITVSPSAQAAATARTGYSSIIDGARAAGTSTPARGPARTTISATGSPLSSLRSTKAISAPISLRVVNRPPRNGLTPTPRSVSDEPGTASAATTKNAADEGSPGTLTTRPSSSGWPTMVISRPPSSALAERISAPKWRSRRSLWSRVGAASITVVSPGVLRPASSTADLTWADGTGGR